jgi:hypothetical protein
MVNIIRPKQNIDNLDSLHVSCIFPIEDERTKLPNVYPATSTSIHVAARLKLLEITFELLRPEAFRVFPTGKKVEK